jgi:phage gp36-like protein
MPYVTPAQLAESPGAQELAQSASTMHQAIVDSELMDLTLRALPRDGYTSTQIEQADEALARIVAVVAECGAVIDAHIARRVALPLLSVPPVLTSIARALVRYQLQPNRVGDNTDPIIRGYAEMMKLLRDVRDGTVTLGIDDPASASAPLLDVRIESGSKVFGRDSLRNFR